MASMTYQLVMRSGPAVGKAYPVDKSEIYIGRDVSNDIVINDAEISRKHARMIYQGGSYLLEDLGSTNGTFVNGQKLMGPHPLHPGELVMFGETISLVFEAAQFDPNATVVSATPVAPPPAYQQPEPARQPYTPPQYAQQAPLSPEPVQPKKRAGCGRWLLAGCGCLVVLVCLIVVGLVVVYVTSPQTLEGWVCTQPLRPVTEAVLSLLGTPYYCP